MKSQKLVEYWNKSGGSTSLAFLQKKIHSNEQRGPSVGASVTWHGVIKILIF